MPRSKIRPVTSPPPTILCDAQIATLWTMMVDNVFFVLLLRADPPALAAANDASLTPDLKSQRKMVSQLEGFEFDVSDDDDKSEEEQFAGARAELEKRCKECGLSITEIDGFGGDDVGLQIGFPCGRNKRSLYVYDLRRLKDILSITFEKYTFLDGYDAICSYEDGEIEALVRPLAGFNPRLLYTRVFGLSPQDDYESESGISIDLEPDEDDNGPTITLGLSQTLRIFVRSPTKQGLSLTLKDISVTRHDRAVALLQKVVNSLFF